MSQVKIFEPSNPLTLRSRRLLISEYRKLKVQSSRSDATSFVAAKRSFAYLVPVYEYKCGKCGEKNEFLESLGIGKIVVKKCKYCGSLKLKRVISSFSYTPPVTLEDLGVKVVPRYDYRPKGPPPGGCPYERAEKEAAEKAAKEKENPTFIL